MGMGVGYSIPLSKISYNFWNWHNEHFMVLRIMEEIESPKHKAMSQAGATREVAYSVMVAGLGAERVTTVLVDGRMDEKREPDHNTRHKFMDSYLRAVGDIKPDALVDNRKVSINMAGVSKEAVAGLLGMVADVKAQLNSLRADGHQTGNIIDITP